MNTKIADGLHYVVERLNNGSKSAGFLWVGALKHGDTYIVGFPGRRTEELASEDCRAHARKLGAKLDKFSGRITPV
jgi:hypothetical protein